MATQDKCCTIVSYFKVSDGKLQAFRALCEEFVAKTQNEPKCLYYGFSFDGDQVHCREGYADAQGLLAHLDNVAALLQEVLKIAEITRLEVHGPRDELELNCFANKGWRGTSQKKSARPSCQVIRLGGHWFHLILSCKRSTKGWGPMRFAGCLG